MCNEDRDLDETSIERLDKILTELCNANKLFDTFIKQVIDVIEIAEAAGCPRALSQIVNK